MPQAGRPSTWMLCAFPAFSVQPPPGHDPPPTASMSPRLHGHTLPRGHSMNWPAPPHPASPFLRRRHKAYCDARGRYLQVPLAATPQLEHRLSLAMQERTRRSHSGRLLLVYDGDSTSDPSPLRTPLSPASPHLSTASLGPAEAAAAAGLGQQGTVEVPSAALTGAEVSGTGPSDVWHSFARPPQRQQQQQQQDHEEPPQQQLDAEAEAESQRQLDEQEDGIYLNLLPFMNRAPLSGRWVCGSGRQGRRQAAGR